MIAFISDIHANLAALNAVLDDIEQVGGIKSIYCLGDVIGYGPEPVECFDIAARVSKLILLGNHEHAVLHGSYGFTPIAKRAVEWTRSVMEKRRSRGRRQLDLMADLPTCHLFDDIMLVHGSPRDHVMEYVLESDTWEGSEPGKLAAIFQCFDRLCFVGHTHRPGVFTEDECFLSSAELADGFDVTDGSRYLINVGSVGQPRDRDPRACYTVFSGEAVYFRRVPYDIDRTTSLIHENPKLNNRLATRLYEGV
ncbi:MAG: metallophosphoesterase family protein [Planctomycetota bacterium]